MGTHEYPIANHERNQPWEEFHIYWHVRTGDTRAAREYTETGNISTATKERNVRWSSMTSEKKIGTKWLNSWIVISYLHTRMWLINHSWRLTRDTAVIRWRREEDMASSNRSYSVELVSWCRILVALITQRKRKEQGNYHRREQDKRPGEQKELHQKTTMTCLHWL